MNNSFNNIIESNANERDLIRNRIDSMWTSGTDLTQIMKGGLPVGHVNNYGKVKLSESPAVWKYVGKQKAGTVLSPEELKSLQAGEGVSGGSEGSTAPSAPVSTEPKQDITGIQADILKIASQEGSAANKAGELMELGLHDAHAIAAITGVDKSKVVMMFIENNIKNKPADIDTEAFKPKMPTVGVNQRWDAYEMYLDMFGTGMSRSLIAYGTGGAGKTFTLKKVFDKEDIKMFDPETHYPGSDDYDAVMITGKATTTALYRNLYLHNGKKIVFDDCDSVLQNEDSINLLKGALDSGAKRMVSYFSGKPIKTQTGEAVPEMFEFKGGVAFISNLTAEQMPQPIRSRALTVDLTMNKMDTIERFRSFIDNMEILDANDNPISATSEQRHSALNFMEQYKDNITIGDMNTRTLGQIVMIMKRAEEKNIPWKDAALTMFQ